MASQTEGTEGTDKKAQHSKEPPADGEEEEVDMSCLSTPLTAGQTEGEGESIMATSLTEEAQTGGHLSQDMTCTIGFLVSPATSRAWTRFKTDQCMDDAHLLSFLLKFYEDTQHGTLCPVCRSQCQQYCSTCCTVVQGFPRTYSTGNSHSTEDSFTSQMSHQHTTARRSTKDENDTDSDCSVSQANVSLDNDETDPELNLQESKYLTSAIILDDRLKGVGCVSTVDIASVFVSGSESNSLSKDHRDRRGNTEEEHKIMNENDVAKSRNADISQKIMINEESLRNKTHTDFNVMVEEVNVFDSVAKSKKRESTKPDCVMCTWCEESFQTIRALTMHLVVHTTQAWQRKHLLLSLQTRNNKRESSHKSSQNNTNKKKCTVELQTTRGRVTRSQTVYRETDNDDCGDSRTTEQTSLSTGEKECLASSDCEHRNVRTDELSVSASGEKGFQYQCTQCGEGAKTAVMLMFHMQTAHAGKDAYKCLQCSLTFRSLRSLANHLRTHPSQQRRERDRLDSSPATHPHQCGPCGRRFMHIGSLANHVRRHRAQGLGWVCSHCQSAFSSMTELTSHHCPHNTSPGGQGSSDQCPGGQGSSDQSPGGQKSKDTVLCGPESSNNASQDVEQNVSESKIALNMGQKQQEEEVLHEKAANEKPVKRRGRKPKPKNTLTGLKEARRPFRCSECPATFQHASVLKLHSQKHSGEKAFPCDLCPDSFGSKTELFRHQESAHWKGMPITCKDCGRVFTSARGLDEHQVVHTGERPYVCEECGQAFPYRGALTRHRRTHRASYFQCEDCGAEFHLKSQLTNHVDVKHRAEKPHLCWQCGEAFSTLYKLRRHADVHGKKQFICELCGKAFRKRGEHKMHLLTHQAVKPHQCGLCERSFISRCKLKLHHTVSHLGIKPFPCTQCTATFSSATYLRDHMQHVHSSQRLFPCHLCQARFAAKRLLNMHLRRTHRKKGDMIHADSTNLQFQPSGDGS